MRSGPIDIHAHVLPDNCLVNFDNIQTIGRATFRRHLPTLSEGRMAEACRTLATAAGC